MNEPISSVIVNVENNIDLYDMKDREEVEERISKYIVFKFVEEDTKIETILLCNGTGLIRSPGECMEINSDLDPKEVYVDFFNNSPKAKRKLLDSFQSFDVGIDVIFTRVTAALVLAALRARARDETYKETGGWF